eukprot:95776-Alexandrium_andersonii.AAC.1
MPTRTRGDAGAPFQNYPWARARQPQQPLRASNGDRIHGFRLLRIQTTHWLKLRRGPTCRKDEAVVPASPTGRN